MALAEIQSTLTRFRQIVNNRLSLQHRLYIGILHPVLCVKSAQQIDCDQRKLDYFRLTPRPFRGVLSYGDAKPLVYLRPPSIAPTTYHQPCLKMQAFSPCAGHEKLLGTYETSRAYLSRRPQLSAHPQVTTYVCLLQLHMYAQPQSTRASNAQLSQSSSGHHLGEILRTQAC